MNTEQKQSKQLLKGACGVALMMALSLAVVSQRTVSAEAQEGPPAVESDDADAPAFERDGDRGDFEERRKGRRERWEARRGERDGDSRPGDFHGGKHHGRNHRGGDGEGHRRGGKLGKYLGFVNHYISAVQDPYQATGLALMGIKDYYRKNGKPADAIPHYEALLKNAKDQKTRNILMFAIRQVYEETKDSEKALAMNKQILSENVK